MANGCMTIVRCVPACLEHLPSSSPYDTVSESAPAPREDYTRTSRRSSNRRAQTDGRFLATGCNKTAQIYDTTTAVKMCTLSHVTAGIDETRDMYVRCVYFSPDDKYLAAGGEDKQIRVWDIAERRVRMTFEGHQHEVYSLVFSHDGRWIVSGSGDRTVRIWDVNQGTIHKILTVPERENADAGVTSSGQLLSQLNAHRDSVYSVVFTPDGYGRPRLTASPLKHPHRCRGVLESMRIVRERQRPERQTKSDSGVGDLN
ncbi:WD40-repeat-containing domain protein [Cubamyces menziesii]|nr:WD40-repeat-containing domain protein [Cubamyces menziesii]